MTEVGFVAIPKIMPFTMEFHADAIFAFFLIFLVSATETIGDTSAMTAIGLRRNVTEKRFPALLPATASSAVCPPSSVVCRLPLSVRM